MCATALPGRTGLWESGRLAGQGGTGTHQGVSKVQLGDRLRQKALSSFKLSLVYIQSNAWIFSIQFD